VNTTNEALYLFCLCRAAAMPSAEADASHNRPFLHRIDGLAAMVKRIPLEEFAGKEAEQHMQQLEWLGPRVQEHEAVIEDVLRASPVLPARFGTLFSNEAALERFMAINGATVERFFNEVEDKDELGVKTLLDRVTASERLLSNLSGQLQKTPTSKGVSYLQERQMRARLDNHLRSWLAETSAEIANKLDSFAVASKDRPVGFRAPDGEPQIVSNQALLVPRNSLPQLRNAVDEASRELAPYGLRFELSGPWPPYSFCPELESV
jgi:hypothetical protein